jgi:transposase
MTIRHCEQITCIGLATCGKGGTRLAARLGMHTSRQTLLRRIMALPDPPLGSILYLGIDDFSFRRGGRFGTILVNLESHRVVDLLPDRRAETVAAWMRKLPDLMVVSRDRGGEYASAAAQGAPQALQCADRFHLLKNLGEAIEGLLAHHLAAHCKRQTQATLEQSAPVWRAKRAARPTPQVERLHQARREERLALSEQVIALHKQGLSRASHCEAEWALATAPSVIGSLPEPFPNANRVSKLLTLIRTCHISSSAGSRAATISPASFANWWSKATRGRMRVSVTLLSVCSQPGGKMRLPRQRRHRLCQPHGKRPFSSFIAPPKLRVEEQEQLDKLRQIHPEVDRAYDLVQQFAHMLRTRTGECLDAWLAEAAKQPPSRTSVLCGWDRKRQKRGESRLNLVDQ